MQSEAPAPASFRSSRGARFDCARLRLDSDPSALRAYAEFFGSNGDHKDPRALQWLHARNPAGGGVARIALCEERWAALYAVAPVLFQAQGETAPACQSLDTLTDRNYRGHGLFPMLARDVYADCRGRGLRFVYGFPNAASAPLFFGRLGWRSLDPVPFLIRPLKLRYFVDRLLGRVAPGESDIPEPLRLPAVRADEGVRTLEEFGADATELWDRFAGSRMIAVRRDARYLNWRLVAKPGAAYSNLGLYRDGLRGCVSVAAYRKHGGAVGYIMELLHEPTSPGDGATLMRAAMDVLRRAGCDVVLAWRPPHSPNADAYRRNGFFPLPKRLRPIELHWGVADLGDAPSAIFDRRAWYLSYLDSDTV